MIAMESDDEDVQITDIKGSAKALGSKLEIREIDPREIYFLQGTCFPSVRRGFPQSGCSGCHSLRGYCERDVVDRSPLAMNLRRRSRWWCVLRPGGTGWNTSAQNRRTRNRWTGRRQ